MCWVKKLLNQQTNFDYTGPEGSSRQNPNDPRGSGFKTREFQGEPRELESKGDSNEQGGLVDCSRPKGLSVLQSE